MAAKRYLYKVYRSGEYVGMLPNSRVISEFSYSQDINTAGPKLPIKLAATLDDAGATTVIETLQDENGNDITDQYGEAIYTSVEHVFGSIPIDLGNRVVVYAFYDGAVNGMVVFDGLIMSNDADERAGTIDLSVVSYGVQLDNYLIAIPPGTAVAEQTAAPFGSQLRSGPPDALFNYYIAHAQTFQLPTDTTVSGINLVLLKWPTDTGNGPYSATVTLRVGPPDGAGSAIASVSRTITFPTSAWRFVAFTFSTPVTIPANTEYSFTITNEQMPPEQLFGVAFKDADAYSSGQRYYQQHLTGWTLDAGKDLAFQIIASTGNAIAPFLSEDPGAIIRTLLDNYEQAGGLITYDDDSVDLTNTEVSYTFKANTVYEGVRKCLELAPANWYWYVDPGSKLLHFHRAGSVADHTFSKGKHLSELKIGQTLDEMKNIVYFSGGEVGGVNLVQQYDNSASTARYGNWLQRENDQRVTREDTAATISRGIINQNSRPVFRTEIEIPAAVYDIETVLLGDMVDFGGYNDFINSLLLQVVGKTVHRGKVRLRLATNPPSVAHRIEDIRRNLDNLYTVNNPDD